MAVYNLLVALMRPTGRSGGRVSRTPRRGVAPHERPGPPPLRDASGHLVHRLSKAIVIDPKTVVPAPNLPLGKSTY